MDNQIKKIRSVHWTTDEIAKMAMVAALYVVITVFLAPFSFGQVQLRVAEMFNFLALYNKRYVWSVVSARFSCCLFVAKYLRVLLT